MSNRSRSHTLTISLKHGRKLIMAARGETLWDAILDTVSQLNQDFPGVEWSELRIGYKSFYTIRRDAIERHIAAGTQPNFCDD